MFTEMWIVMEQRIEFARQVRNPAGALVPKVIDDNGFVTPESLVEVRTWSFGSDLVEEISKDFCMIKIETAIGVRPRRRGFGAKTPSPDTVSMMSPGGFTQISEESLSTSDDAYLLFAD
ncbi:MAG: hypothetical protein P1U77_18990, partial [Rubripirellula sp.]|nr:hypothetical protein [Rubripirellula sp.]